MTKSRLRTFSFAELFQIAQEEHIGASPAMDKESLVSLIHDALEEEKEDREGNHSLTIRLEAKKFSVSQDEELILHFGNEAELPRRYKDNTLVLMLRDPSWVYCYWDLEDRVLTDFLSETDYLGLFLRIIQLVANDWGTNSTLDWFDIPIQFADLGRYINLPATDTYYGVELYARLGEREMLLARSNIVDSSRDMVVAEGFSGNAENREKLFALSDLSSDVGAFPGSDYSEPLSPQRIIGAGSGGLDGR